ncbi:MAG: hypothetical protein ACRCZY_08600 [Phocaeicola sp.]
MKICGKKNLLEMQRVLDSCIDYEYNEQMSVLSRKQEYMTNGQTREYLNLEVFRVINFLTEMRQNIHELNSIDRGMNVPDFLWESLFLEELTSVERSKYFHFQSAGFNMNKYKICPVHYDKDLPYFSSIIQFVANSKYLEGLQKRIDELQPKDKQRVKLENENKSTKSSKKKISFESKLTLQQIGLLVACVNEVGIFTVVITEEILVTFFKAECIPGLKFQNISLFCHLMIELYKNKYITKYWQAPVYNKKLILAVGADTPVTKEVLSSTVDRVKLCAPKESEIIDKYIKKLQKCCSC